MTGMSTWLPLAVDAAALSDSINAVWVLTVSFLIFFMQPGFVLLEAGQVRSKNVANIATKNLFDWSLGVLLFFVVGLGLAKLVGGITSPGGVSLGESFAYVNDPGQWIGWLFGAVFAMTAATIVSGAVAERVRFKSYVAFSVVLTGIIYPVVVGLTWQGGLLSGSGYLGQLLGTGYLDFAGGTVVHMVGGLAGLVTASILGPRRNRFDEDGSSQPIPGHSVLFAVVGTLFLAFGWYGFNVGTQATVLSESGSFMGPELGRVALTTTLAMGGGGVASSLVTTAYQGKPDPLFTANGLLGGLVAVTSAAASVTWWGGLALGVVGGALVYPTYKWTVESLGVDDVCGVFAVHGAAGGVGAVLVPLFGVGAAGGWAFLGVDQLLMQVLGVAIIGTWTVLATMVAFGAIDLLVGVRVGETGESDGLDQNEHNIVAYPQFATDGGTVAGDSSGSAPGSGSPAGPSSQGRQESDEATMWRGEQVQTAGGSTGVLDGAGIEQFPDPTLVVDERDEITAINPRAVRFFETVEAQATGATPGELVAESDGVLDATADALDREEEVRGRRGQVTVGDETVPVRVTATPLREEGRTVGALATVRNDAEAVARERHRRTVEEYRETGLEHQREKLADLADGSLDVEPGVPAPPGDDDELAALHDLFEEMDGYLVETAGSVRDIVERLPGQSEDLAESSESLSASSGEVRGAIGDIDDLSSQIESETDRLSTHVADANATVSDLSASIEEISASTSEMEAQSDEAAELTREGVAEMTEAVSGIRTATERSEEVAAEIDSLEEKMDAVAEIVDIIQDIADQTNMLALNANIEAARADADGDGFAVVADEVKSLAEETRESAADIADIVGDVQSQTDRVVGSIREANAEIASGTDAVEDAVGTLERIQGRIEETNDGLAEISAAVARQADDTEAVSATMQEVTTMTGDIDDLASQISGRTDEQAAAMEQVTGLADRLSSIAADVHANIDAFDLEADLRGRQTSATR